MNARHPHNPAPCRVSGFPRAFSLIEVLVATAVLALLMVLLLQVVTGTMQSTRIVTQQLDATESARRAIDILSADISRASTGGETSIACSANGGVALLLPGRGPSTSSKSVRWLGVSHATAAEDFIRSYSVIDWTSSTPFADAIAAAGAAASADTGGITTAPGVLAVSILYRLADGSLTNHAGLGSEFTAATTWNGQTIPADWKVLLPASEVMTPAKWVVAIDITLACADPQNLAILQSSGKLASLKASFAKPVPAGKTPSQFFETVIGAEPGLPAPARAAIRHLTRTLRLP